MTHRFGDLEPCVDWIVEHLDGRLIVGAPLGLGKPNALLNALYMRAKADPAIQLTLYTALSLDPPTPKPGLESRFLQPFLDRHFGPDYPRLAYLEDIRRDSLPGNVAIHEFYLQSGIWLQRAVMQRSYISMNYTHVTFALAQAGVNLVVQLIAEGEGEDSEQFSLSSNTDLTRDLIDKSVKRPLLVGCIHPSMPFMGNDAAVDEDFFDALVDGSLQLPQRLFALPRQPVEPAEFALGIHAASLIRDGGTLQIGIGALSDALVHGTLMRHRDPKRFAEVWQALAPPDDGRALCSRWGGFEPFEQGLYGASEMIMDGFMHLVEGGVVKRQVFDDLGLETLRARGELTERTDAKTLQRMLELGSIPTLLDAHAVHHLIDLGLLPSGCRIDARELVFPDGRRIVADLTDATSRHILAKEISDKTLAGGLILSGAFFLGTEELYRWMRGLPRERRQQIGMTRISRINDLAPGYAALSSLQRRDSRFFNTCMMHTLLGAAVSDALEDGQVVSGVGGQYNFVSMAHRLPDGRSVLMLRSTRDSGGKTTSNIIWNYAHHTIPRHLRDVVVTEYGAADLGGQSDENVIRSMIEIADARFHDQLLSEARKAGKLHPDWQPSERARGNTPERIHQALKKVGQEHFPRFPFGSDLDEVELQLAVALRGLAARSATARGKLQLAGMLLTAPAASIETDAAIKRMGLSAPSSTSERLQARLLRAALAGASK